MSVWRNDINFSKDLARKGLTKFMPHQFCRNNSVVVSCTEFSTSMWRNPISSNFYFELMNSLWSGFLGSVLRCVSSSKARPLLYPPLQRSWKGGILVSRRLSVCPSVCGQNRVRSVSSTILVGSISYLHILSSKFRMCVMCKDYWTIPKFEFLANFWNL